MPTEPSGSEQHPAPSPSTGNGVHPGHVLVATSFPLLGLAYRDYHTPLESSLQYVLREQRVSLPDLPKAEESARRAVAFAVASRALRVSTLLSCGVFGLVTACAFYSSGCSTFEQAIKKTQQYAFRLRSRIDLALEVTARVDANHPEMKAIRGMDEQEELSHIGKTYLSDWDNGSRDEEASKR